MAGGTYCGQCGQRTAADQRDVATPTGHAVCLRRAELEPPRYCPDCARRMVVQVDPMGWRAVCSQHGELHG